MCILCCNTRWRSAAIGALGLSVSLTLVLLTLIYRDPIEDHLVRRLKVENCEWDLGKGDDEDNEYNERGSFNNSSSNRSSSSSNRRWTSRRWRSQQQRSTSMEFMMLEEDRDECVLLVFWAVFPWPLWITLVAYAVLSASLVVASSYNNLRGVTIYLSLDAVFVGLLAAFLCLSFFPTGLTRVALLTLLFPLLFLSLCAWMTVFGFYLRLEERERRREEERAVRTVKYETRRY